MTAAHDEIEIKRQNATLLDKERYSTKHTTNQNQIKSKTKHLIFDSDDVKTNKNQSENTDHIKCRVSPSNRINARSKHAAPPGTASL